MRTDGRSAPPGERLTRRGLMRVVAAVMTLAAAPTFTLMALLSSNGGSDAGPMICADGAAALGGMSAMYLLMAAFHLVPWLRLIDFSRGQPDRA